MAVANGAAARANDPELPVRISAILALMHLIKHENGRSYPVCCVLLFTALMHGRAVRKALSPHVRDIMNGI
jgi:hypothetical protein